MSGNIPTPHIQAAEGDFADLVLMPGDPLRAKFIADTYLEDVKQVNGVRNMLGYTGFYKGKRISVMGSGMGMPSIGLYTHELFNFYNVDNIIRIGSAGALRPEIKVRDIVIGMSAYTDSGFTRAFGFAGSAAPCCSYELLRKAMDKAEEMGIRAFAGPIFSSDLFYSDNSKQQNEILAKQGVLAIEMESAALYLNAARAGKNALCICTISDSLVTGEITSAEERQEGFTRMMELALSIA